MWGIYGGSARLRACDIELGSRGLWISDGMAHAYLLHCIRKTPQLEYAEPYDA
jgi:hypothetical protein